MARGSKVGIEGGEDVARELECVKAIILVETSKEKDKGVTWVGIDSGKNNKEDDYLVSEITLL